MRPFLAAVIVALLAVAGCASAPSVDQSAPQPSPETSSLHDPVALAEGLAVIRCGRPAPDETEDVARVVSIVIGDLVAFLERQGCPPGNNPFAECDGSQCRGEILGRQQ